MEKVTGKWVLYETRHEKPYDKPMKTYVGKFDCNGDEVVIAMRKYPTPSVKLVDLRSREHLKPEQTVKTVIHYSVKIGGKVARSRKEAEEAVQRVTGVSIPKKSRVITGTSLFDEIEADFSYE